MLENYIQEGGMEIVVRDCELLKYIASLDCVNSILEIGSGLKSTLAIRESLRFKKKGFCVSLEDKEKWFNSLTKNLPDDDYGKIQFSPIILSNNKVLYSYIINQEYDFILIDGPGKISKKGWSVIYNECCKPDIWISVGKKRGTQSIFIMDYIKNAISENTIILVDSRVASVYYYLQKYKDNFCFMSHARTYGINTNSKCIKKEYIEILNDFRIGYSTLICYKNSKILEMLRSNDVISEQIKIIGV